MLPVDGWFLNNAGVAHKSTPGDLPGLLKKLTSLRNTAVNGCYSLKSSPRYTFRTVLFSMMSSVEPSAITWP